MDPQNSMPLPQYLPFFLFTSIAAISWSRFLLSAVRVSSLKKIVLRVKFIHLLYWDVRLLNEFSRLR